jgi:hypothetical protein
MINFPFTFSSLAWWIEQLYSVFQIHWWRHEMALADLVLVSLLASLISIILILMYLVITTNRHTNSAVENLFKHLQILKVDPLKDCLNCWSCLVIFKLLKVPSYRHANSLQATFIASKARIVDWHSVISTSPSLWSCSSHAYDYYICHHSAWAFFYELHYPRSDIVHDAVLCYVIVAKKLYCFLNFDIL